MNFIIIAGVILHVILILTGILPGGTILSMIFQIMSSIINFIFYPFNYLIHLIIAFKPWSFAVIIIVTSISVVLDHFLNV